MNNKELKIGFIGGGINSAVGNTHKIASQMDNQFSLEAGCFSRNKKINLETAAKYGIDEKRLYHNWKTLIKTEKENLDAISVLTPTNAHAEIVITALKAGYPVICEKALGASYQEAVDICKAVRENNGFLAVTYNYTGYPMIRELREMIKNGDLGNIKLVQLEMPQESFIKLDETGNKLTPQEWRLKENEIPTVSLDLGIHLHNMIDFLTEESPIEVVADQSTLGNFDGITDNVMCIARYTNGLKGQIWYSKSALGYRNGLLVRIYGDQGSAEWLQMKPEKLQFTDVYGQRKTIDRAVNVEVANDLRYERFKPGHPAGFIEAFANQYYDIATALENFKESGSFDSPFVFDCRQAKEGLKMLDAINLSAESHNWQVVNSNFKAQD